MIQVSFKKGARAEVLRFTDIARAQAALADRLEREGVCVVIPVDAWRIRTETGLQVSTSCNIYSVIRHHCLPSDPHSRLIERSRQRLSTIYREQAGKLWSLL